MVKAKCCLPLNLQENDINGKNTIVFTFENGRLFISMVFDEKIYH